MLDRVKASATAAAARADLVYVNDGERGYVRRRAGKGFSYADSRGKAVDKITTARIKALAIPPAWSDVWICADAAGHIQATGRDQRGRKQYRYHPAWTACRDEAKFSSLASFAHALPALRHRVEADLRRRGLPRDRVVASVVWLLDNTLIRIGNDIYAQENKSFGLTTLRSRHLDIQGSSLRFTFKGKSGQEWKLKLADRRIARIVRAIQDLPGQHLFQYIDEQGARREVSSHDVNAYIQEAIGQEYSSKHFRTWGASVFAAMQLADTPLPETKRAQAMALNAVLDRVAGRLRNTRAVCRRCYVHPAIVDAWLDGTLQQQISAVRKRTRRPFKGLDVAESTFLRWLKA
ncbi:DNA topoisomerase IB [Mesorhizobium microcysteis]|uniref:DNA topoisomerase n=1 Tax=Neoaquamicrobium microcysteis TaxID=2682781 RepID=A0A5D4HCA6_9HYPH|nr:DNA topoisomerase IB [Mesorhizobium microcysteis]TYR36440.1 DNA topoisomerase IB [Mesorhizobium microcysteis]